MPVLVEVKEPEAQEAVRRVLVQEEAVERCVVASEHQAALEAFSEPPFSRAAAAAEISELYWGGVLRRTAAGRRATICSRSRSAIAGLTVPTRRFVAAARGSAARCTSGP